MALGSVHSGAAGPDLKIRRAYRGRIRAIDNAVEYFCFITFFPHMVAGPIQQATHLLVQFEKRRRFDWDHAVDGL